ncbi:MAG: hypothetical protein Q7R76_00345 [Candidatus Woesearchaeota archaeon]|nr:hypothetical protein [Candidatus Woesearchaeota archaeon]
MNAVSASWSRTEKKRAVMVLFLVLLLVFTLLVSLSVGAASATTPDTSITGDISPDAFKALSPEDQLHQLQAQYRDELAALFYGDTTNIGKDAQLDLRYFNTPANVLKNLETSKTYFQRPDTLQQAREGARAFFANAYQANYVFDASATRLAYNSDAGTLSSGGKIIRLADFFNNKKIKEIRAVRDDFEITEVDGVQQKTITFSGAAPVALAYKEGVFSLKNQNGETHTVQPDGSSRFALQPDGTLTIEGAAHGTLTINKVPMDFRIRERIVDTDDTPSLTIQQNGDITTGVRSDVELNTPTLYLDGTFAITGGGKEVYTYSLGGKQGMRKGVDLDDQETNGETVLVDKMSGIGVISSGQDRKKNEFVLTHLDQLSDSSELVPKKLASAEQAREKADGLRRESSPSAGQSAEVFINHASGATTVYSRGKVMVRNYFVSSGQVVGTNQNKASFTGSTASSTFDFVSDQLTPPARTSETFVMNGEGIYTDKHYRAETQQSGARLSKRDNEAFLSVACNGCQNGNAAKIVKNIAVVSTGDEITSDDIHRQSLEITADVRGGKLEFDVPAAALKDMNDALDADESSFLAFDSPLYVSAEGGKTFFGIGSQGIGRYETKINGKTQAVSIVMNGKSMLGQPQEIKTGIDVGLLSNPAYAKHLQQSFSLQDRAEAQARTLGKQFNIRIGADGSCLDKACSAAMKQSSAALGIAMNELQKTNIQASNELNNALLVSAQKNGEETKGIKKAIKQNDALYRTLVAEVAGQKKAGEDKQDDLKRAAFIGEQLRSVDVIIRGKERKIAELQEQISASKEEQDWQKLLKQVNDMKDDRDRLDRQRYQLEKQAAILDATYAESDPATSARISLSAIGVDERYRGAELQRAKDRIASIEKKDPALAAFMGMEADMKQGRSPILLQQALKKYETVQQSGSELLKLQAQRLKTDLIDRPLADAEYEKMRNAYYGEIVDDETGVRISKREAGRQENEWDGSTMVTVFGWALKDVKEKRESDADKYGRDLLQAANAQRIAAERGIGIDEWNKMGPQEKHDTIGEEIPLGDTSGFYRSHGKYMIHQAAGTLTPQQEFNVLMAAAEEKMHLAADPYAAKEDLAAIQDKFWNQRGSLSGFDELRKFQKEVEKETIKVGITYDRSFDLGRRTTTEMAGRAIDITTALDLPVVGSVLLVKAAQTGVQLARAGKLGRRLMRIGETVHEIEQTLPTVAIKVVRPLAKAAGGVARTTEKIVAPIRRPLAKAASAVGFEKAGDAFRYLARREIKLGSAEHGFLPVVVESSTRKQLQNAERMYTAFNQVGNAEAASMAAKDIAELKIVIAAEKIQAAQRSIGSITVFGKEKPAPLETALGLFETTKQLGKEPEIRLAAVKVTKAAKEYEKSRDVALMFDEFIKSKMALQRSADDVADVLRGVAANIDEVVGVNSIKKCASPCELTDAGKAAAERLGLSEDTVRERFQHVHDLDGAAETTEVTQGMHVMEQNRAIVEVAPLGSGELASGAYATQPSIEGLEAAAGLAPGHVPQPGYAARAEVSRHQIEAAAAALEKDFGAAMASVAKPAEVPVPHVRDEAVIQASIAKLTQAPSDTIGTGVARYQLWVDKRTGAVQAVGKFGDVGEAARNPSNINIVMIKIVGKASTPVDLGKYLTPTARQTFLDTMREFERVRIARTSELDSLAKLQTVTSAERPIAKQIQSPEPLLDVLPASPSRLAGESPTITQTLTFPPPSPPQSVKPPQHLNQQGVLTKPFERVPEIASDIPLDMPEGTLLETRAEPPKIPIHLRTDISDTVKDELIRLGVKDIMPLPSGIKAKKLTSAVDERSILGKLEKVDLGISQARIVERTDGTKAVWKIDTSNPISARLQHGEVIGLTDGGRRQLGMASILDEFDDVVVPRMRRLQTIDGYGVIESEFIPDYVSISKNPRSQFKKLSALLKDNHLTSREYTEITEQAERQAIVNLVFGNGDVELGFIKLPHSAGDDPSSYIRLVRFDEEQAFLGILDYPILHQSVSSDRIPQVLSSANDHIFGLFNYEDFIKQGEFDFEKAERKFSGVVKKLDDIVSDESEFLAKMKRAGYTDDEARTILKGAQKNVGKIKQELSQQDRGLVQKLIENDGDLLPTANGEYISINERMARQFPRQPGRSEPRADYAKQVPDQVVVGEFVPRREQTTAQKSSFELPAEFHTAPPEYTASIRGKVPRAVVTQTLPGGDSGGSATVFIGRIEGVDKDVALKIAKKRVVTTNLEDVVNSWNHEVSAAQELEQIIPTPHYYGIVDIGGNPAMALEIVEGIALKGSEPLLSTTSLDDIAMYVNEKSIRQLEQGLRTAEEHGWLPDDIQYMVLTKDQVLNGKQYTRGDVIFFDFGGWEKIPEPKESIVAKTEAVMLRERLQKAKVAVATKQKYPVTNTVADSLISLKDDDLERALLSIGVSPESATHIKYSGERRLEAILEEGINPNEVLARATGKQVPIVSSVTQANHKNFPVNIPPGAAKFGFTHLEELERLSGEGKSEQAWSYFTRFKDEILPDDAQKLEPYLQTNRLTTRAKINDLEAWIGIPAGKTFLETPEGKEWYGEHKQSWFFGLFQPGKLKKGTLETAETFPSVFVDESKYAAKAETEVVKVMKEEDLAARVDSSSRQALLKEINALIPNSETARPVAVYQIALQTKIDHLKETKPTLEDVVSSELGALKQQYGVHETLLSLMDLFYLDTKTKGNFYFIEEKVRTGLAATSLPGKKREQLVRVANALLDGIKKRASEFESVSALEYRTDPVRLKQVYSEVLEDILTREGLEETEILDDFGRVLANQKTPGSVRAKSEANSDLLIEFDKALDTHIQENGLPPSTKVVGLLGDIEPVAAVRLARKGGDTPVQLSYVSRISMMSDAERLDYYRMIARDPGMAAVQRRTEEGMVYSTLYKQEDESGIMVEARDAVASSGLEGKIAYQRFMQEVTNRLKVKLDTDPAFAQEAWRIYREANVGDEDVVFVDSTFKGTIPAFLAALHQIKYPHRRAVVLMYAVKPEWASSVPHFIVGTKKGLKFEHMSNSIEIGAFSEVGPLVKPTSPKDQLLAAIDLDVIAQKTAQSAAP